MRTVFVPKSELQLLKTDLLMSVDGLVFGLQTGLWVCCVNPSKSHRLMFCYLRSLPDLLPFLLGTLNIVFQSQRMHLLYYRVEWFPYHLQAQKGIWHVYWEIDSRIFNMLTGVASSLKGKNVSNLISLLIILDYL